MSETAMYLIIFVVAVLVIITYAGYCFAEIWEGGRTQKSARGAISFSANKTAIAEAIKNPNTAFPATVTHMKSADPKNQLDHNIRRSRSRVDRSARH